MYRKLIRSFFICIGLLSIKHVHANYAAELQFRLPVPVTTNTICFIDNTDYKWVITYTVNDDGSVSGNGTAYFLSGNWSVAVTGTINHVQFHVKPPDYNNCTFTVDSLLMNVTGIDFKAANSSKTWNATAKFVSYCFGGPFKNGPVAFAGPCGQVKPPLPNHFIHAPEIHENGIGFVIAPNPIKNNASISINISTSANVKVIVYNYLQQPVQVLFSGMQTVGKHVIQWNLLNENGTRIPAGLYRVVAVVNNNSYSQVVQVTE